MNEHQIACFLQVVETRSFSKAAADIHITQPAITHQIAMLEKELGVSLFQRTSKGVNLTAAGNSFLPASQNLSNAFRKAYESVNKAASCSFVSRTMPCGHGKEKSTLSK